MSTGSGGGGGATRDRIKTSRQSLMGDAECQARIPHRRVPFRPGEGRTQGNGTQGSVFDQIDKIRFQEKKRSRRERRQCPRACLMLGGS